MVKEELESLTTGQLLDILGDDWQTLINARKKFNWFVLVPNEQLRKALIEAIYETSDNT